MTDTLFYDDMAELATELMNDFGTPATLRWVEKSKPDANGDVTKTPHEYPGLAVRIQDEELINLLNLGGELLFAMKFPAEPQPDWELVHVGLTVKLIKGKKVNPEGNRLIMAFFSGVQV